MKKLLVVSMLLVGFLSVGCTKIAGTNTPTTVNGIGTIIQVPSSTYVNQIKPLIVAAALIYGQNLTPQQQTLLNNVIAELDKQAAANQNINVIPALVAVATPILLEQNAIDAKGITPQQAAAAMVGLEILKSTYVDGGVQSDVLELTYPILRDILAKRAAAAK